ncbi:MAG TPA: SIS domain-containing protein [Gaiellales bacterium]|jgi:glucose/mannose-6-phosphate isomerase|nr:SIS domain-containing protein [Gaiellales bacterium]
MSRYEEMFGLVGQLGSQLREGYAIGQAAFEGARPEPPATATISALGGSAIGGSLAEALWRDSSRTPTFVNRADTLPGWVGEGDLVLPVSYSGATGETLAAARAAVRSGAGIIAITSGGPLERIVSEAGGQVVRVPGGLPPRAALGTLFGALAAALEHVAAIPSAAGDIRAAAHACDAVAADRGGSLASALGEALATTTTWVYGYGPLAAVARRFKSQLNENAKSVAAFAELPEADHNEIVGWAGARRTGGRHAAIHLSDPDDPVTIRATIATTPRLIDDDATLHRVLTGEGQTRAGRTFWLLSLLDHTSVHTARAAGVDPFEIDRIGELKQALAAAK